MPLATWHVRRLSQHGTPGKALQSTLSWVGTQLGASHTPWALHVRSGQHGFAAPHAMPAARQHRAGEKLDSHVANESQHPSVTSGAVQSSELAAHLGGYVQTPAALQT